jgi:membrane protease YdiL (CAAX protease family)
MAGAGPDAGETIRIRHDSISKAFTLLAIMITLYLATWEKELSTFFPAIVMMCAFGMSYYLNQRVDADDAIDEEEAKEVGYYTIFALAAMALAGTVSTRLFVPRQSMSMLAVDAVMYGVLIAVAEEQMFRGAILQFLGTQLPRMGAILAAGAIFGVYHFSVYRSSPDSLMYVFGAGVILSWVAARTGRLSPTILAHVANNVAASLWMIMMGQI